MRLFTAIDIPEEIKARLHSLIERLRPTAKLSWSPAKNLHVTTKFIGEWPEPRLTELKSALASVPPPGPVSIGIRGLGWFPNPKNPRVFWAGIEGSDNLPRLARDTEAAVARLGVPVEPREFQPHLTLARRRDPVPLEGLRRAISDMPAPDFGSFSAASFILYLSASGRYTPLEEFSLIT